MRTLKLQTQVSLDGYMSGPNGEMDWMTFAWDDALKASVAALTKPVDTILLGRKLAQGFIPHWAARPADEPAEAIEKMNGSRKVVFSKSLSTSPWANTVIAKGPLRDEVQALKAQPGGDLIAYGGGDFVSSLLAEQLVDEVHLFVSPVALGGGMKVFRGRTAYQLVTATPYPCGVVELHYRPAR
ncbi:MAG: dihydrofolate reductase family protein [Myxococcus sp.]|nr:dihydrofolate reductase family protein [Myxococcus sp.]